MKKVNQTINNDEVREAKSFILKENDDSFIEFETINDVEDYLLEDFIGDIEDVKIFKVDRVINARKEIIFL